MLRGRRAALASGLAIAAAAAVSAGCGSATQVQAHALTLDPVSAAATKTQHAGAARVRFSLALKSPQLGQGHALAVRGTGAIDGMSSELTLDLGALLHSSGLPLGAGGNGSVKEVFLERNGDYVLADVFRPAEPGTCPVAGGTGCVAYPVAEPGPRHEYGYRDRDRDGVPNRVDRDRDNDGVPNAYDRRPNDPRRY